MKKVTIQAIPESELKKELQKQLDKAGSLRRLAKTMNCGFSTIHGWLLGSDRLSPKINKHLGVKPLTGYYVEDDDE